MSGLEALVEYHLKKEPIVYKYVSENRDIGTVTEIYMIKSITQKFKSYNVVCENENWICDCPSYKFKTGVDSKGHCKHIKLVIFLIDEKVEIKVI